MDVAESNGMDEVEQAYMRNGWISSRRTFWISDQGKNYCCMFHVYKHDMEEVSVRFSTRDGRGRWMWIVHPPMDGFPDEFKCRSGSLTLNPREKAVALWDFLRKQGWMRTN